MKKKQSSNNFESPTPKKVKLVSIEPLEEETSKVEEDPIVESVEKVKNNITKLRK